MPFVRVTANYGGTRDAEGVYSETSTGVWDQVTPANSYSIEWDDLDTWQIKFGAAVIEADDGSSGSNATPVAGGWQDHTIVSTSSPGEIPASGAGSPVSPGELPPSDGGGQVVTSLGSIDPQGTGNPPSSPGAAQPRAPQAPTPPEDFVGTFAQTLTAAQQTQARTNIGARKAGNGLFLDFDRADLYPDATEFSYGSVNWNDGVTPLRVNIDPEDGGVAADYQPYIENGGVRPADRSVVYLGGNVNKEGEVFSMGVDFTLNEGFSDSVNTICLNVSFKNVRIQDALGIYPVGSAHFNLSSLGVNQASIFDTSGVLTAANRTKIGSADRWDENNEILLESGKRYTLIVRAWGDTIELTIKGVGTVVYQNAGFTAILGPDMHFWVEPFPATSKSGAELTHYCTVHRVWAMDEARDSLPAKNNRVLELKQDVFNTNGFPLSLGSTDLYDLMISPTGSTAFPSSSKEYFFGGNVYLDGGFLAMNVGINNTAGTVVAFAAPTIPSGITDRLSSSAGAETTLYTAEMLNWLNGSESETHVFFGELVGTNAKKIEVGLSVYAADIVLDSNASGTPLDAIQGPFMLTITRFHHDSQAFRFTARLDLPDGSFILQSRSSNSGSGRGINNLEFRTTTVDAGGIVLDGCIHDVRRVIVPTS